MTGPYVGWGAPWVNTGKQFSAPVFVVPHSTPRLPVEFHDPWTAPTYPTWEPVQNGFWANELAWRLAQGVPIPDVVLNDPFYQVATWGDGGSPGDSAIIIVDAATNELWEFWLFAVNPDRGGPSCSHAGWMPDHRLNNGVFQDAYPPYQSNVWGSSATSISIAGAQISQQELIDGVIPHAIGLDVMAAAAWWDIAWPAQRGDGNDWGPIQEGTRFRLDPTYDISTINCENDATATRTMKMIAKAMQDHGLIVWDKGGSMAIQVEPGPFNFYGAASSYTAMLRSLPLNSNTLQVVDPNWRP